jgi:hypothetical protein
MGLFRKKCDADAAHAMLKDIVVMRPDADASLARFVADLASPDLIRREFIPLRLFAVLVAFKATQYPDWQAGGRDVFDMLFESTLQSIMFENGDSELLARLWLGDKVKYYSLVQYLGASIDEQGTEVGRSFAMLFADRIDGGLARLGTGVFFRALEQSLDRHSNFKLVQAAT